MLSLPNHVQHDILKSGIDIMTMRAPTAGMEVDLDVAGARGFGANPDHGPAKIRASLVIFETRMKNSHDMSVQGLELVAQQTLLLPDSLEQFFGRRRFMVFLQSTARHSTSA